MAKNILSLGQQNQGTIPNYPRKPYKPVPANQQVVLYQPKPWNEMLPVEQWLRDFANTPNSTSVFPAADGQTYGQMLQNNPIKPNKPQMTITEEGRKIKDEIDKILHKPTVFSPENLDKWSGHGPNPEMDNLNNWYSSLEQADNVATNNKLDNLAGKIDQYGNKLDEFGNKINEFGEKFDQYGNKLDEFGNKIDDFGNRFNNIDDHLGKLDGKVDDIYQNIDKLKRGVGEANGKIIGKIDGLTETVTGLNGKIDDVTQNVDKLKRGLGEVSGKIIGKIDEQGKVINELANKTDDIAQNVDKLKRGLGEVSGKIIAKVDDNSKAIGELGSKVDDIAKQMSKQNTKMALIGGAIALAGIAAAGIAGYLLGKNNDKDDKVQAEDTTPVVKPEKEEKQEETTTVVKPEKEEKSEETTPVVKPEKEEKPEETNPVDPNSPIDTDGNATVQKGDGLWHIAERYLEYKFKNEPDKFKNLSETEKNQMIWKEVHRIADLNGFKLVSSIIKGKKLLVTDPMLHTGDKVQVVKKVDIAA